MGNHKKRLIFIKEGRNETQTRGLQESFNTGPWNALLHKEHQEDIVEMASDVLNIYIYIYKKKKNVCIV
jgi:hypothetical protein